jgi:hypothetical protein
MNRIVFILLLLTVKLSAQEDDVNKKKIRVELQVEGGVFYGTGTLSGPMPWGAHLYANSFKNYGVNDHYGLQICFFNKFTAEVFYSNDQFQCDKQKMLNEMRSDYGNYFIQEHAKYAQYDFSILNDLNINCFQFGLAGNIRLRKNKYIQPYAFYSTGKTELPKGELVFKDYNSNNFITNRYTFDTKTTGCVFGVRLKHFSDSEPESPSVIYAHAGIKIEYAIINMAGTGHVLTTDGRSGAQSTVNFDIKKSFRYMTVGVFFGLGSKDQKYKASRFFSE